MSSMIKLSRVLSLMLCVTTVSQAANIVFVTDFEATADADFITALSNAGHTLTSTNERYRSLDSTKIAELNAADLVLVSRNTSSGSYADNSAEIAQWDAVTTTVWLGNSYLARSNRWNWVSSTTITAPYFSDVTAQNAGAAAHPLYDGLTSAGTGAFGETKYGFTDDTDLTSGSDNLAGSGTVLGVRNNASNQHIIAAEFASGSTTGSGNTLAGDRFYFALPEDYSDNNSNGLQMIDNIIDYTAVPEPSSVALLLLGAGGCFIRRRR